MLKLLKEVWFYEKIDSQNFSSDKKRSIILTNKIALILACSALPYFFLFSFTGYASLSILVIPLEILLLTSVLLNRNDFFKLSKWILMTASLGAIFYYSCKFGKNAGIQSLYFAFIGVPLVIFDEESQRERFIALGLPLGLYILLEVYQYHFFYSVLLNQFYLSCIFFTIIATTFFLCLASMVIFIKSKKDAENSLKISLDKQEKITQQLSQSQNNLQHSYTELKEMHERLKESIDMIEGMSHQAMLGGIMRGIGYEIQNPLTNIYSVCEMVLMNKDLDEKLGSQMRDIIQDATRLSTLVATMLKNTTSVTNASADIDIAKILDQIRLLMRDPAFHNKVQLEFLVADNLPPIKGTEAYVFQALLNLAVNALNHTKAGGKLTIEARDNSETAHVQISITDTGEGIPPDILPHIFESGVSSKKGVLSAGLGLAFVKRVLDAHHATIHVSSTVGEGSCFTVAFPTLS